LFLCIWVGAQSEFFDWQFVMRLSHKRISVQQAIQKTDFQLSYKVKKRPQITMDAEIYIFSKIYTKLTKTILLLT